MRGLFFIVAFVLTVFFNNAKAINLPVNSRLITIEQTQFHLRELGHNDDKPTIVLLSGPNQHWHSDSAWFSLLQPVLAKQYRVISIDRLGNGWSSFSPDASYQSFAQHLPAIFAQLALDKVILVNFASSNLVSRLLGSRLEDMGVKGEIWLDPDILLPHSIELYSGYPANWYKTNIADILPHIAGNNWLAKTLKRNNDQVITIDALIPPTYRDQMDWPYFNAIQKQRLTIGNQQTVALEIAHYQNDLELAARQTANYTHPISIIDSDFELHGINEDDENYQKLLTWQQEGSQWSREIAAQSGGHYYPVNNASHLLMFEHPELMLAAIESLLLTIH